MDAADPRRAALRRGRDRPRPHGCVAVGRRPIPRAGRAADRTLEAQTAPALRQEPSRRRRPALLPGGEVRRRRARHARRVHVAVEPLQRLHRPRVLDCSTMPTVPAPSSRAAPTTPRDLWPRGSARAGSTGSPTAGRSGRTTTTCRPGGQLRDLPNVLLHALRRHARRHRRRDAPARGVLRNRCRRRCVGRRSSMPSASTPCGPKRRGRRTARIRPR